MRPGEAVTVLRLVIGPLLLLVTVQACHPDAPTAPRPMAAVQATSGAVQLAFVKQPPANVDANVALSPAVQVAVEDSAGNPVPGATDTVTLALGPNQTGALLLGSPTALAVDGMATFVDLRVDRPGSYTLVATATGLTGATSTSFAVHVTFTQVSAGYFHTCGVTTSGAAYCWGYNFSGQLGDGTGTSYRTAPAPVAGGLDDTAVSAGGGFPSGVPGHTCGTTAGGAAYCWGYNASGQLGDGTTTNRTSPVPVSGGLNVTTVGAGTGHTCAVTTSGEAYCWGANFRGQLGDGSTVVPSSSPVRVFGVLTFTAVGAGSAYSCGLTTGSVLACWGFNGDGELGDGTTVDRPVPAPDLSPSDVAGLSTGTYHACAVTTNGGAYCWGYNTSGQLGDGTTVTRMSATPVAGGLGFAAVSAGYQHSCGVTPSGAAYCWGWNAYGQLGDGTTATRPTAGLVSGGLTFRSVSTGVYHTCGVTTDGVAYCWGYNPFGALGNGTTTSSPTPVPVVQ